MPLFRRLVHGGNYQSTGRDGAARLENIAEKKIVDALKFGQALAALNCCFEGARGAMYVLSKAEFENEIGGIMSRKFADCPVASEGIQSDVPGGSAWLFHDICGSLREIESTPQLLLPTTKATLQDLTANSCMIRTLRVRKARPKPIIDSQSACTQVILEAPTGKTQRKSTRLATKANSRSEVGGKHVIRISRD